MECSCVASPFSAKEMILSTKITSTNGSVDLNLELGDELDQDHEQHHLDRTAEAFNAVLSEFDACEGPVRCLASLEILGACESLVEHIRYARKWLSYDNEEPEDLPASDDGEVRQMVVIGSSLDDLFEALMGGGPSFVEPEPESTDC